MKHPLRITVVTYSSSSHSEIDQPSHRGIHGHLDLSNVRSSLKVTFLQKDDLIRIAVSQNLLSYVDIT